MGVVSLVYYLVFSIYTVVPVNTKLMDGYYRQARKQASGDPSDVNWNYRGITLLYKFTTPYYHGVISHNCYKIVAIKAVEIY